MVEEKSPQPENQKIHQKIHIEPASMVIVGIVAGVVCGALMVILDPLLRFPDVSVHINWRETLLSASVMSAYAAVLGWMVTTFWRRWMLWLVALMTTPIVTGVFIAWNNINAPFGLESDLLLFLPIVFVFHMLAVSLVVLYLRLALHLPSRRLLAYTAIPVVLTILTFVGLGRLRWSNQDARDVMSAINQYAHGAVNDDFSIEYLGMRYSNQDAPIGDARIYTDDETLYCRARLYPQNVVDVSCSPED